MYKQIIITIIKEFILEKLDLNTLLLVKDKDELKKLVASQSNYFTKVEDLNYSYSSTILSNINSNLSYKYLKFYLRYFTYFRLDLLNIKVDSYIN